MYCDYSTLTTTEYGIILAVSAIILLLLVEVIQVEVKSSANCHAENSRLLKGLV